MNINKLSSQQKTVEKETPTSGVLQQIRQLHTNLLSKLSNGLTILKESLPTVGQQSIAENILTKMSPLKSLRTTATILAVFSANPAFAQTTLEFLNGPDNTATIKQESITTQSTETPAIIQQLNNDKNLPKHTIQVNTALLQQALKSQATTTDHSCPVKNPTTMPVLTVL
jgi:hypothetical protein